jgi:hypothetical protein
LIANWHKDLPRQATVDKFGVVEEAHADRTVAVLDAGDAYALTPELTVADLVFFPGSDLDAANASPIASANIRRAAITRAR